MQAVYKKRFIARQMQENGIRVFADLNVSAKYYKLNMIGIPMGYSSFCTRGYSDRLQYLNFELEMAKYIANGNPLTFVVYGGGSEVKKFCQENSLIYVTPVVVIKNKLKSLERIKESIAFFNQDLKTDKVLPSAEELFSKQIENFTKIKEIEK